jgi:hypothetical protein
MKLKEIVKYISGKVTCHKRNILALKRKGNTTRIFGRKSVRFEVLTEGVRSVLSSGMKHHVMR